MLFNSHVLQIVWHYLLGFIFFYPLFMSFLWMFGAIFFYFRNEYRSLKQDLPQNLPDNLPGVSILIPCYNEGLNVQETITHALALNYPTFEVIAVNDGSKDNTLAILLSMMPDNPKLKVVNLAANQGKAMALQAGSLVAQYEFLIAIDGDALIDKNCAYWMVRHFIEASNVAAVTGNPRIRNRTTLLGKIQVGEFSSIIGIIKRAQRTLGRLFTVSGVITAFRKSAVHQVKYWSPDMLTEDIDITWKLQRAGWDVRFEPRALVWILMPETLKGLWKQRLRWAMGGIQVMFKNIFVLLHPRQSFMWPLMVELVLSLIWTYAMVLVGVLYLFTTFTNTELDLLFTNAPILPNQTSVILISTCLLQFAVSKWIDSHYDQGLRQKLFLDDLVSYCLLDD
ncbi:poly-beta-1,6-N-acetyl-D-glucosamine synthase [Pelistega indica]|uniref:poly-beta-1,6-N-acetyl-D-glucosamine synthase n=1 Tax=Pelistega indica TaxID=1414851 RepID=UPI000426205D|nr:poly-beta-1,6-N-acetyl-D-glucosamine synthase [Pelistega indica]